MRGEGVWDDVVNGEGGVWWLRTRGSRPVPVRGLRTRGVVRVGCRLSPFVFSFSPPEIHLCDNDSDLWSSCNVRR